MPNVSRKRTHRRKEGNTQARTRLRRSGAPYSSRHRSLPGEGCCGVSSSAAAPAAAGRGAPGSGRSPGTPHLHTAPLQAPLVPLARAGSDREGGTVDLQTSCRHRSPKFSPPPLPLIPDTSDSESPPATRKGTERRRAPSTRAALPLPPSGGAGPPSRRPPGRRGAGAQGTGGGGRRGGGGPSAAAGNKGPWAEPSRRAQQRGLETARRGAAAGEERRRGQGSAGRPSGSGRRGRTACPQPAASSGSPARRARGRPAQPPAANRRPGPTAARSSGESDAAAGQGPALPPGIGSLPQPARSGGREGRGARPDLAELLAVLGGRLHGGLGALPQPRLQLQQPLPQAPQLQQVAAGAAALLLGLLVRHLRTPLRRVRSPPSLCLGLPPPLLARLRVTWLHNATFRGGVTCRRGREGGSARALPIPRGAGFGRGGARAGRGRARLRASRDAAPRPLQRPRGHVTALPAFPPTGFGGKWRWGRPRCFPRASEAAMAGAWPGCARAPPAWSAAAAWLWVGSFLSFVPGWALLTEREAAGAGVDLLRARPSPEVSGGKSHRFAYIPHC